jgi:hypothetical protein
LPHRTPVVLALALCAWASPTRSLAAQDAPLVLEVHGGAAVPLGSFANGSDAGEGVSAGSSLSLDLLLPGTGWRGLYAGFSQHRFGCEDAGCAGDGRIVATGFDVGVRLALLRGQSFVPWIRIGAITTRVETDDLGDPNLGVSKLGFGGEVGFGVLIGSRGTLGLNPGVRYALVGTELPGGSTLNMHYLVAQVAATLAF